MDEQNSAEDFVAQLLTQKFQETVFQRAFKPFRKDIADTPMMLRLSLMRNTNICRNQIIWS